MDLFKPGTYVDTPYRNFFEIRARNLDNKLISMSEYEKKVLLIVNISPYSSFAIHEMNNLQKLKEKYNKEQFEILAFPNAELDNLQVTDSEIKSKLLEIGNPNFKLFNRVYLKGNECAEVFKYCMRYSSLFRLREGTASPITEHFSKFLITKNGKVASYIPNSSSDSLELNIENLLKENDETVEIRKKFTKIGKVE